MEVTIEHSFCPYCDEAIELYFRIVNTILFSTHEDDLRAGMEHLKNQTLLDEYSSTVTGRTTSGSASGGRAIKAKSSNTGF